MSIESCLVRLHSLEKRHKDLSFEEIRDVLLEEEKRGWILFVEKYSRFVYTVALKLLGPVEDREEFAHQIYSGVFSKLREKNFRILREFQGKCDFKTYLFRIVQTVRSKILKEFGRHRERLNYMDFERELWQVEEKYPSKGHKSISLLKMDMIKEFIEDTAGQLSPRELLLLRLRFERGLTFREIASLMNFRDTNKAAYEFRRILKNFDFLKKLKARCGWTEEDYTHIAQVLGKALFEGEIKKDK